jgi:uncharacterized phage-like protein YoqJ
MRISITASRDFTVDPIKIIEKQMKKLILDENITKIYFGGARGGDTYALIGASKAKEKLNKSTKLIVVVPDTIEKQTKEAVRSFIFADEVIELKNEITPEDSYASYGIRNVFLVDNSDEINAFWNGHKKSGTFRTIKYAWSVKKQVNIHEIP